MNHLLRTLLLILALWVICGPPESALAQVVQVNAKSQPDAPLLITVVDVRETDPRSPEYEYRVVNRSDKSIRAYTISLADGGLSGSEMSLLVFALKPGASQNARRGDSTYSDPVKAIHLSLDFVEFTDGSIWGPDRSQTALRLSAMREGMAFERDRLLKALAEGGKPSLVAILNADPVIPMPPDGHSELWQGNFKTGTRHFWHLIQKANREGGVSAVESELALPCCMRK